MNINYTHMTENGHEMSTVIQRMNNKIISLPQIVIVTQGYPPSMGDKCLLLAECLNKGCKSWQNQYDSFQHIHVFTTTPYTVMTQYT